MSKKMKWSSFVFALSLAAASPLMAQNGPPPGGPGGGGPGGGGPGGGPGGPPNAADRREHDLERIQDEMDLADDKWKLLEPKLEKLMEMEEDLHPHGPPRPDQDDDDQSPLRKALDDLRDSLQDRDAKADDVQAKVDAYEKVKATTLVAIKKAQDELRPTLTPIQQAILITHGVLD